MAAETPVSIAMRWLIGLKIDRGELFGATKALLETTGAQTLRDLETVTVEAVQSMQGLPVNAKKKILRYCRARDKCEKATARSMPKKRKKDEEEEEEGAGGTATTTKLKKSKGGGSGAAIEQPAVDATPESVTINRSPVMVLWATAVVRRVNPELSWGEALSIGGAVMSVSAHAHGKSLGLIERNAIVADGDSADAHVSPPNEVEVLGETVQTVVRGGEMRGIDSDGKPVTPRRTQATLRRKFGTSLGHFHAMFVALAEHLPVDVLMGEGPLSSYEVYKRMRPDVPRGKAGWGAAGLLHTSVVADLTAEAMALAPPTAHASTAPPSSGACNGSMAPLGHVNTKEDPDKGREDLKPLE